MFSHCISYYFVHHFQQILTQLISADCKFSSRRFSLNINISNLIYFCVVYSLISATKVLYYYIAKGVTQCDWPKSLFIAPDPTQLNSVADILKLFRTWRLTRGWPEMSWDESDGKSVYSADSFQLISNSFFFSFSFLFRSSLWWIQITVVEATSMENVDISTSWLQCNSNPLFRPD